MSYAFVNQYSGTAATQAITIASGQSLIIIGGDGGATGVTLSCADTLGNTYTPRQTVTDNYFNSVYTLFDCINAPNTGATTITISNTGADVPAYVIYVYTGLTGYQASNGAFSHAWATTTNAVFAPVSTISSAPAMLFGLCVRNGSGGGITNDSGASESLTTVTGWTNSANVYAEDYAEASTGSVTAYFTLGTSGAPVSVFNAIYGATGSPNTASVAWIV